MIDKAVSATSFGDLFALQETLKSEGVALVLRTGKTGLTYGLTYVDHRTKVVFNGKYLPSWEQLTGLLSIHCRFGDPILKNQRTP